LKYDFFDAFVAHTFDIGLASSASLSLYTAFAISQHTVQAS